MTGRGGQWVAACLKWVDTRPEVDALTGDVREDLRSFDASPADQAALEVALRLGEAWDVEVVALCAGPLSADALLHQALAVGAAGAIRVELAGDAASEAVAAALAEVVTGAAVVCCGDLSLDRGSGSVPAFLAARLEAAQALGLVAVGPAGDVVGALTATRRLDRGRREHLELDAPAVVSVEASCARLRRAGLAALLDTRAAPVLLHRTGPVPPPRAHVDHHGPYRPRPQVRPGPDPAASARQRILAISGPTAAHEPPRVLRAGPGEAAAAILDQLAQWGYR